MASTFEYLVGLVDHDPQLLGMASQLVGAVSAGLTGGDARLAADIAGYDTAYNYLNHEERQQLREAERDCLISGDEGACGTATRLRILDEQRDATAEYILANGTKKDLEDLFLELRTVWPSLCAPPYDCSADATKVAGFQSRALTQAQALDQAALFEWFALGPLNAALRGTALTLQASRPGVSFLVEGGRLGVQGALTVDPWLGAAYDVWSRDIDPSAALLSRYGSITTTDIAIGVVGGGLLNRFFGLPMRQWSSTALGASRWSSPEAFVIQMNQDVLGRSLTAGFGSVPDYSKRSAEVQP